MNESAYEHLFTYTVSKLPWERRGRSGVVKVTAVPTN